MALVLDKSALYGLATTALPPTPLFASTAGWINSAISDRTSNSAQLWRICTVLFWVFPYFSC